jgi:hypothetical protein
MSEPSVSPERERVGPVLLIALGLFVLIGAVGFLMWERSKSVDARETLTSWFVADALPFGLVPVESAELAIGDRILRLAPADGIVEPERKTPDPAAAKPGGAPFDWTKLELRPSGDAPCEVFVVRYAPGSGKQALKALFDPVAQTGGMIPATGGRAVLDRGDVTWREWSAPYVLEREYEAGGTARDTVRVNLTRGETAQVCFARFPRGSTGSPKKVEELLAALAPK